MREAMVALLVLGGFTRCTKKCEVRFFADIDVQCNGILDTDPD